MGGENKSEFIYLKHLCSNISCLHLDYKVSYKDDLKWANDLTVSK